MDKLQFAELMEKHNVWKKVDFKETIGKTVKLVIEDDLDSQNVIVFTDDTFICLRAIPSWEGTAEMAYLDPFESMYTFISLVKKHFPGFHKEFHDIEQNKRKAQKEETEYQKFLELQKKYAK